MDDCRIDVVTTDLEGEDKGKMLVQVEITDLYGQQVVISEGQVIDCGDYCSDNAWAEEYDHVISEERGEVESLFAGLYPDHDGSFVGGGDLPS